jgi:hypothetical protein
MPSHHYDPAKLSSRATPVQGSRTESSWAMAPGERYIREGELYGQVVALATERHIWLMHVPDSRTLARGWPDLVLVSGYGVLFRELKTEDGVLSPSQVFILQCMKRAGLDVAVWRPQQLWSGQVEAEMNAISPPNWQHAPRFGSAVELSPAECSECGRTFQPRASNQRYCSDACRSRVSSRKHREAYAERTAGQQPPSPLLSPGQG